MTEGQAVYCNAFYNAVLKILSLALSSLHLQYNTMLIIKDSNIMKRVSTHYLVNIYTHRPTRIFIKVCSDKLKYGLPKEI